DSRASSRAHRDARFDAFLARLQYKQHERAQKLAAIGAQEQREHQYGRPMLSKNSARIVERSMAEGRYQSPERRSASVARQRAAEQTGLVAAQQLDPDC